MLKRNNFNRLLVLLILLSAVLNSSMLAQADKKIVNIKSYLSLNQVLPGSEVKLGVKFTVSEGWHINGNKPKDEFMVPSEIAVAGLPNIAFANVSYPPVKEIKLGFQDEPLLVYEGVNYAGGILRIPDSIAAGDYTLLVTFSYQGCNNQSCNPPDDAVDTLNIKVAAKGAAVTEINQDVFSNIKLDYTGRPAASAEGEEDSLFNKLEKNGLLLSLILVFFGGLALNLTPCVYPLIPITIGFFGGQSEGRTSRLALMGLLYMLGIALTYSIVGVVTALSGAVFGALLQNPIVILFVVAVLIILSLSMFGLYDIRVPEFLIEKAGDSKTGLYGAFFMGLTMGIVAAPCIGPFVLGLVTYVAAKADPLRGFLLFFVLAMGLGLPYFVLALFSGKIKKLPRSGVWMEAVKHIFGFILVGMALYFALPLIPKVVAPFVLPVFMIITGLYLIIFEKAGNNLKGFKTFKIVFSALMIVLGIFFLIPQKINSIEWQKYSETGYQTAIGKKPVIIDFYADWCIPCKELDKMTFSKDNVIKESKRFAAFKADMTKSVAPEVEALRAKFAIRGVPTVILIDSHGKEIKRVTGFMPAEEFLPLMKAAQ